MPSSVYPAARRRIARWLFRTGGAAARDVVLVQRRVFILPTRQGLLFGGILILMLLGSVNYNLSVGYILTFLLAAMGLTAMLHTFRNLALLKITAGHAPAVFAGERARFSVTIENPSGHGRYAIGLTHDRRTAEYVKIPPRQTTRATIAVPAPRRGVLRPGRLTLFTRYPLGWYRAWSYLELDLHCLVYPHPAPPGVLPPAVAAGASGPLHGTGEEDFAGLRPYAPGDAPKRIAWKAAAREQTLLTKQFSGRTSAQRWLAWEHLPPHLGTEEKLSRLTRWVLDAHADGVAYGLKLPSTTIALDSGEPHRDRCLEALALHDLHDDAAATP